jgi:integrase
MRIRLTPAFVAAAVAESGKDRTVYWDDRLAGFGLMVTARGARSFVAQYRVAGKSRRYTLDGVLGLEAARKAARGILGEAAKGLDPLAARQRRQAAATNTLRSIGDEYLARESERLRTAAERKRILERLIYPKLGTKQIDEIRRSDIVRVLDGIADKSGERTADYALAVLRRVFNWHASRSDDFSTPIRRGMARQRPREQQRTRILTDDEVRAVWRAAEGTAHAFDLYIRFLLLTATRRSEAAGMKRSEVQGGDWTIPGSRHKSKADFLLPLSQDAQALIGSIPRIGRSKFIFTTDGAAPLGGFSKFKREFDKRCGVTGWTLHDLRRTARSLMSRVVPPDHAERAIGHVIPGVRGVYDRYSYRAEKLAAMEALASEIRRILAPDANVVPLRGAL